MIRAVTAMEHHKRVVEAETASLRKLSPDFSKRVTSLPASLVRAMIEDSVATDSPRFYSGISKKPTPSLRLVALVFSTLRQETSRKEQSELKSFLGTTLLPIARLAPTQNPEAGIKVESLPELSACTEAEALFSEAADQVAGGGVSHAILRTYHDSEGRAIAFGKENVEDSALLLRPTREIPAGTIVRIGAGSVRKTGSREYKHWVGETYQADSALALFPARISAWSYDEPIDRSLFAVSIDSMQYDARRSDMLCAKTLADFQDVAGQLLAECGINKP